MNRYFKKNNNRQCTQSLMTYGFICLVPSLATAHLFILLHSHTPDGSSTLGYKHYTARYEYVPQEPDQLEEKGKNRYQERSFVGAAGNCTEAKSRKEGSKEKGSSN